MFAPIPLSIPPGVIKEDTPYGVKGRYIDTQMVRFWAKRPERWGGWQSYVTGKLDKNMTLSHED